MENYIIKLTTPCCKRSVLGVALMLHASINVKRTCPKCKARFSVTLVPVKQGEDFAVHTAEWNCYKSAKENNQ